MGEKIAVKIGPSLVSEMSLVAGWLWSFKIVAETDCELLAIKRSQVTLSQYCFFTLLLLLSSLGDEYNLLKACAVRVFFALLHIGNLQKQPHGKSPSSPCLKQKPTHTPAWLTKVYKRRKQRLGRGRLKKHKL
jgi:hypothetical protein